MRPPQDEGFFYVLTLRCARRVIGITACLFVLFCVLPASAQPKLPPLTGRVVDLAGILSPATEAALTEQLARHEQRTSNQVAVATLPSLQGYDIERFAVELLRAWGLGQKDRNNGVLLLVAPNERAVRIEVGYGLEGTLTDALSSDIINSRILPRFRANDYAGGISSGVDGILAVIEGTYEPLPAPAPDPAEALSPLLIFGLWLVFIWIMSRNRRRRRGFGPVFFPGPVWGGGLGRGGGGFGRGGGGFSGGGGRSGGGGASGRW